VDTATVEKLNGTALPLRLAGVEDQAGTEAPARPAPPRRHFCHTVHRLIALYLPYAQREVAPAHYSSKVLYLGRFSEAFGDMDPAHLRCFDFQEWLTKQNATSPSEWTMQRIVSIVKRVFNWALDMELIERNPIGRFRRSGQKPKSQRKPMSDEDFQTLMRNSAPMFKRLLIFLKFTGARPCEAGAMRWQDVRFDKRCVILETHKTSKKTGKPRIIPLIAPVLKMLVWMRQRRQVSTIGLLERLLAAGPRKGVEVARFMSHYGVSDRAVYLAREQMGVIRERVGGTGPKGYYSYRLPDDYVPRGGPPEDEDHVFMTCRGFPLNKHNIGCWLARLRRRIGFPLGVSLYNLRHRYGFMGVKNKVHLKLLSRCLGHTTVTMTEKYIDNDSLTDDVQQAALEVIYGPGAVAVDVPIPEPRQIPTINPPPVEQMPATTEHLPRSYGNPRQRPNVPAGLADVPLPAVGQLPNQESVESMLKFLMSRVSAQRKVTPRRPTTSKTELNPTHDQAYQATQWAVERNPALAKAKDREVYGWLLTRPDCPFKLPPTEITFTRYVTAARHYHGTLKRQFRRRGGRRLETQSSP